MRQFASLVSRRFSNLPAGRQVRFVFAKLGAETRNEIIHKHVGSNFNKVTKTKKMNKIIYSFLIITALSCNSNKHSREISSNVDLANTLENYYDERMELFPLEATYNGDPRYNHLLPADFTDSYRTRLKDFFIKYKQVLRKFDPATLNDNDKKSHDILSYDIDMELRGLDLNFMGSTLLTDNTFIPFDQKKGLPLIFGQMGSGSGIQPFKTVKDYENWLERAAAFSAWTDSAIVAFKKGVENNYVLPKAAVIKMIPQMLDLVTPDANKSLFYGPVQLMPDDFSDADKKRLTAA